MDSLVSRSKLLDHVGDLRHIARAGLHDQRVGPPVGGHVHNRTSAPRLLMAVYAACNSVCMAMAVANFRRNT